MKSLILLCLAFAVALAENDCRDLTGTWRNQLGSNMSIEVLREWTHITGRYYTAVESTAGAARLSSNLTGTTVLANNGSLIAFSVLWNKGASITTWVGQCMVCGGKEKIFTTWVLRSKQPSAKNWMTTRINQDTFWRVQDAGPHPNTIHGDSTEIDIDTAGLSGQWTAANTDTFNMEKSQKLGIWNGLRYGVPPITTYGGRVHGIVDGDPNAYYATGFSASTGRADIQRLMGWAGHINDPSADPKVLETSWLRHTFSADCVNPRINVQFGMDNFQHSSQSAPEVEE